MLPQNIDTGEPHRAGQEDLSAARVGGTWALLGCGIASACAKSELKGTWSPAQLSASAMIPSKILVYHHAPQSTSTEVYRPTSRRKKSLGDLFHKGYRVRSGPAAPDKDEPQNFWQSLVSCCRVGSSWGKVPPPRHVLPTKYPIFRRLPRKEAASLQAGFRVMSIV